MIKGEGAIMGGRSIGCILMAMAAAVFVACGSETSEGERNAGDDYPSKPITYMIPFDAGGQSDLEARRQQPFLKEELGQSINITYKPGGGGSVGWAELVQQEPDGHYIAGINIPHIILQPLSQEDTGYETEQIEPVAVFQATPIGLAVMKDSDIETLEDIVAAAKENPGQITVAGSGTYSGHHLAFQQLQNLADIDMQYVSFTGAASQVQGFLGGNTTAILANSNDLVSYKDELTILAIGSEERFEPLPDVPTFKELGYDMTASIDRGVAVPPGTPADIVQKLEDAFLKIANDSTVQQKMTEEGFQPKALGAEETKTYIEEKTAEYKPLLEELQSSEN